MAEPGAVAYPTVASRPLGALSRTVTVASSPSTAVASAATRAGVRSSSMITPVAGPVGAVALVGFDRASVSVSAASSRASSRMATVMVAVVAPAGIASVPEVDV